MASRADRSAKRPGGARLLPNHGNFSPAVLEVNDSNPTLPFVRERKLGRALAGADRACERRRKAKRCRSACQLSKQIPCDDVRNLADCVQNLRVGERVRRVRADHVARDFASGRRRQHQAHRTDSQAFELDERREPRVRARRRLLGGSHEHKGHGL